MGLALALGLVGVFTTSAAAANTCPTIYFGPGIQAGVAVIGGGACVSLVGAGEGTTILEGNLSVSGSTTTVFVSQLTWSQNPGNVPAIVNAGRTTLDHVSVSNNMSTANSSAPAIVNTGTMTIENGVVSRNSDTGLAATGGIWNESGASMTLLNTVITQNMGAHTGSNAGFPGDVGGIRNDGTLEVYGSTISNNSAPNDGNGGGIFNDGQLYVSSSSITGNTAGAEGGGGGVYNVGTTTIVGGLVANNTADVGGGIYNAIGATLFTNGSGGVDVNSASVGGGLYNAGNATLNGTTIQKNFASADGGGIESPGITTEHSVNYNSNNPD